MRLLIIILFFGLIYYASACEQNSPCIEINTTNEELFEPVFIEVKESNSIQVIGDKYLGIPYKYGGNDFRGIDCSAFTQHFFYEFGFKLPRTSRNQFADRRLIEIPIYKLAPLDLLFFKNSPHKKISHVAIYIGNGKMIHSSRNEGGVYISEFKRSGLWQKMFFKAKRIPSIQQGEI